MLELLTFGQQSRFDFLQYAMPELVNDYASHVGARIVALKGPAIAFYKSEVSADSQIVECIKVLGSSHVGCNLQDLEKTFIGFAIPC